MIDTEPIFKSVHHALTISFLLEFTQFFAKSNLSRLIDIAAEKYGIEEPRIRSINWGRGTDDLDKKATGAMIRATCERVLNDNQFTLVLAKYSLCPDKRVAAIKKLASDHQFTCRIDKQEPVAMMCCHLVNHHTPSITSICKKYRVSKGYAHEDIQRLKEHLGSIERDYTRILTPIFQDDHVIP